MGYARSERRGEADHGADSRGDRGEVWDCIIWGAGGAARGAGVMETLYVVCGTVACTIYA